MYSYSSSQDAITGILAEVVKLLKEYEGEYIIVGGWSPYLLGMGRPQIMQHPGTKDVDILFRKGKEINGLREIVKSLLGSGYLLSAKHEFQLIKISKVNGTELAFNVDLLHPSGFDEGPEMFVDHLQLDVPIDKARLYMHMTKSIVMPGSEVFFDRSLYRKQMLDATLPDGNSVDVEFNLLDEAGCIISKAKSIDNPKRPRDAFDIYYSIKFSQDYDKMIKKTLSVIDESLLPFDLREEMDKAVNKDIFCRNIRKYTDLKVDQEKEIMQVINGFQNDIMPKSAKMITSFGRDPQ
ncbi:MAG: hypothetical protein AB9917_20010 [Negativicutes bacterium]